MKKLVIITGLFVSTSAIVSCGAHGDYPGQAYMPDMYYSRAYETYGYNNVNGEYDSLARRGITYNALPVPGTVAREDMLSYHLTSDSAGMKAAEALKNPLDTLAATQGGMVEAERLYLVNCGICHGTALDGNGPLYDNGNGPYPVHPQVLNGTYAKALSDGHIFHVITYGIRTMGSYASQLRPEQRWWVIKYLRSKQGGATAVGSGPDSTSAKGANATTVAQSAGNDSMKTNNKKK
jgi:mono/diheme cytochrome c family protein